MSEDAPILATISVAPPRPSASAVSQALNQGGVTQTGRAGSRGGKARGAQASRGGGAPRAGGAPREVGGTVSEARDGLARGPNGGVSKVAGEAEQVQSGTLRGGRGGKAAPVRGVVDGVPGQVAASTRGGGTARGRGTAQPPRGGGTAVLSTSKKKPTKNWWSSLKDVDPITLQPLSQLSCPPFELRVDESDVKHRFDASSLAVYLLSTGKFLNPINRQEISREDCIRLDTHLKTYGPKDQARCVEMMDMQNSVSVTPSASHEEAVLSLRREAGVIVSGLFHYPPLGRPREQATTTRPLRSVQQPTTTAGRGAVTVMDDDVEQWETFGEEGGGGGAGGPQVVEDDFSDQPLVRRLATEADFPGLPARAATASVPYTRPASATVPVVVGLESVSWRSKTSLSAMNTPPEQWLSSSPALPDRSVGGSSRPTRLMLQPRSIGVQLPPMPTTKEETQRVDSLFGRARPVDTTSVYRGSAAGQMATPTQPLPDSYLCPYPFRMLQKAKTFGGVWVASMEKRFKDFVDAQGGSRVLELEPMPEPRRRFIQEIANRYWGLHCVEVDPEPHRFLQVSCVPSTLAPDLLLSRSLIVFGELLQHSALGLVSSMPGNGILFVGCPMLPTSQLKSRMHETLRELQARESEYEISILEGLVPDEANVYVEFATSERARRILKKISASQFFAGGLKFRKFDYWPAGKEWATQQIREVLRGRAEEAVVRRSKMQQEKEGTRQRGQRAGEKTGWDSDPEDQPEGLMKALEKLNNEDWGGEDESSIEEEVREKESSSEEEDTSSNEEEDESSSEEGESNDDSDSS